MNHLKKSQLKLLLQEQTPPCVSIYLPLGGQKPPEDPPLGAARSGEVASDGGLGVELDYIELLLNAKRLLAEDYEA
ncbi:hypothetical protein EB061_11545, partial [bacterium]|nr:hypothetical protein [bacterium]